MAQKWYAHECCHGEERGVVTELTFLPDGSMKVRTDIGFGVVPRAEGTRRRAPGKGCRVPVSARQRFIQAGRVSS